VNEIDITVWWMRRTCRETQRQVWQTNTTTLAVNGPLHALTAGLLSDWTLQPANTIRYERRV